MADTLTTQSATPATVPASTVIATDDAGASGHVQVVKLAISTDGSATPLTADNTDGLLVNLGANNDVTVTGTAAISAASLPLPSGASTAAKQPALGTAGTPSADVITVQGVTSMTALKVDGSGVTQPVSLTSTTVTGTVTANLAAGTNNIGDVDVLTLPAIPAGANTIGSVKITDGTDVALVDASGNLMVNVAAGGAGDGSILDGVSSSIKATVLDYTNSNPLAVRLTDTTGDYVGAGAGTQYTEDAAAAANPTGTALILIREDGRAGTLTTTDGDNVAARGNNKGELYVKTTDSDALLTTIDADTSNVSTKIDTIAGAVAGAEMQVDVVAALPAGANTIGKVVAIDAAGNDMEYAKENDNWNAADHGIIMFARDVDTSPSKYRSVQTDANGHLKVVTDTLPAGNNNIGDVDVASIAAGDNNIGNVDVVTVNGVAPAFGTGVRGATVQRVTIATDDSLPVTNAGTFATQATLTAETTKVIGTINIAAAQTLATVTTVDTVTGGGIAHDGVDSGNPVKVGAKASATLSDDTMVANADRTDLTSDLDGMLYVREIPLGDIITEALSNTDGASTASTNFGATASTRNYITAVSVFRTDTATTMAYIDFRDGTAGAVLYRVPLPPSGGAVISNGGNPLFFTTANTALAFDVSSALTTVYISLTGFKSKARA